MVSEGLRKKRRLDRLYELIAAGREEDLTEAGELIRTDPSSNMYEERDKRHLVNRRNERGLTPLYIAC